MTKPKQEIKHNKPIDLFWILAEIFADIFFTVFIPVRLILDLDKVGIFSMMGLIYLSIVYLLLCHIRLTGIREFLNIKWKA